MKGEELVTKLKKNGRIKAPVDVASSVDVAPPTGAEIPLVVPRRVDEYYRPRRKNPAVVVRVDGRYGVAHAVTDEKPRPWCDWTDAVDVSQRGWQARVSSSRSSGYVHLPETFATRREAECRAWALAREIGEIKDWP